MTFKEKILKAAEKNKSWLCCGLDPDLNKLPDLINRNIDGIEKFLKTIIDNTSDIVCAYKPNSAFYEHFGAEGIDLLKNIIAYVPEDVPVILDAKRGDIGNTSRMYAVSAFEYLQVDALTVNPYMGHDSIKPFLEYSDKGIFILCLTSNPSSSEFQKQAIKKPDTGSEYLYELVARTASSWNTNNNAGLVIGATSPDELKNIRKTVGDNIPILIPGVGAQGGDLESSLLAGSNSKQQLAIINVSRSVLYASLKSDYADKSRAEAMRLVSKIRKLID